MTNIQFKYHFILQTHLLRSSETYTNPSLCLGYLTVLHVRAWFQNDDPSSRLNKTPPIGAPKAAKMDKHKLFYQVSPDDDQSILIETLSCNLQFFPELIPTQLRISHDVTANSLYLSSSPCKATSFTSPDDDQSIYCGSKHRVVTSSSSQN